VNHENTLEPHPSAVALVEFEPDEIGTVETRKDGEIEGLPAAQLSA